MLVTKNDTRMVELDEQGWPIKLDLKYGTPDNIVGKVIYNAPRCLLREEAVISLRRAIEIAAGIGHTFLIYDAYRPTEAQEKLWEACPDERYVADPKKGSNHGRGVAVDLTLLDREGNPLDMGTPFDDMRQESHHGAQTISREAQINRHMLMGIMTLAGWDWFSTEWWHYQLPQTQDYPLISDAETGMPPMM